MTNWDLPDIKGGLQLSRESLDLIVIAGKREFQESLGTG
jgi:hypothetical protein